MGSTCAFRRRFNNFKDHPHIHGEHVKTSDEELIKQGSPPYTWGALLEIHLR